MLRTRLIQKKVLEQPPNDVLNPMKRNISEDIGPRERKRKWKRLYVGESNGKDHGE